MKKFVLIGLILAVAVVVSGCGVTRYDIKPEMKSEILLAKQTKEVALTLRYYQPTLIRPLITRDDNVHPDTEQIDAGTKFLNLVKEELRNKGFVVSSNAGINIEVGFAYRKGILLITSSSIATRWKGFYKNDPLFEISDFKLLSILIGGGTFTEEKGKQLAQSIVEEFKNELEKIE